MLRFPPLGIDIDASATHPATAKLGDQSRRPVAGCCRHFGIGAPLEAMGRLGVHAEATGCPPHRQGIEMCAFQQHVCRVVVDLRIRAAHDSGQSNNALTIGNHKH